MATRKAAVSKGSTVGKRLASRRAVSLAGAHSVRFGPPRRRANPNRAVAVPDRNACWRALELVPLQDELNRFRLRATPPAPEAALVLSIDGKTAGVFTAEELARGIDLVACSWTRPSTAGSAVMSH